MTEQIDQWKENGIASIFGYLSSAIGVDRILNEDLNTYSKIDGLVSLKKLMRKYPNDVTPCQIRRLVHSGYLKMETAKDDILLKLTERKLNVLGGDIVVDSPSVEFEKSRESEMIKIEMADVSVLCDGSKIEVVGSDDAMKFFQDQITWQLDQLGIKVKMHDLDDVKVACVYSPLVELYELAQQIFEEFVTNGFKTKIKAF